MKLMILNGSPQECRPQCRCGPSRMRPLCLFIALVCLALLLPSAALGEEAEESILTKGAYEYVLRPGGDAKIVRYSGDEERLTLPKALDGHPVTAVGDYAFSEDWKLAAVAIPSQVTDLGANPFAGCLALTQITVDADHPTLTVVNGALYDKRTDTLIAYPAEAGSEHAAVAPGTRSIGDSAFAICRWIVSVELPEGIESIGAYAFSECISLAAVSLPDSLRSIGDSAFSVCSSLWEVTLPGGLTALGQNAFADCASLESVTIPDSLTDLAHNPFLRSNALARIGLSPAHPTLGVEDGVLYDKPSARLVCYPSGRTDTAFTVPAWVRQIGAYAFSSPILTSVTLSEGVEEIGTGAFTNCPFLVHVGLPDSLRSIGDSAFAFCQHLSGVSLPAGLARIGQKAFYYCGEDLVFTVPRGGYPEDYCRTHGYAFAYADAPGLPAEGEAPRPLEHPKLGDRSIGRDQMNLYVYWVQVRLKATGKWYQGEEWDCTGNLGSHTMSEIAALMRSAAGYAHDGTVDQAVIDLLLDVPDAPEVLVGGFYDRLNILTGGDPYGDMTSVGRSSPRDAVLWVQTCLKHLGYYTSALDGKFGSGTLRALHAFQKQYGWVERDHVSYGVARDLLERYVASGGDPDALPGPDR